MALPPTLREADRNRASRAYRAGALLSIPAAVGAFFIAGYVLNSFLLLSIAAGSIGGIIHDLIENKGDVVFPHETDKGFALGLLLGTMLGAVSGFIGYATTTAVASTDAMTTAPPAIDAKLLVVPLTWGLGLKGLVDAAGKPGKDTVRIK